MKSFKSRIAVLCALLLLPALASAASDMYLKIKGVDGETRVISCPDGACAVDALAAGKYTVLVCDAEGKVIASDVTLKYAIVSPRDAASGQASGKRMHKPIRIQKQLGRGATPGNVITVEEAGTRLAIGVSDEAVDAAQARVTKTRSNIQNN